jgi:hypothetical protein
MNISTLSAEIKHKKRAIYHVFATYILGFILIFLILSQMAIDITTSTTIPDKAWYVSALVSIPLIAVMTWHYLKKNNPTAKHGLAYGLLLVSIGVLIDTVVIVILSSTPDTLVYFTNPLYWFTITAIIGTSACTGLFMQQNNAH